MLKLISLLDSLTPFVQALDCLLMLVAGFFCLRARRRGIGFTVLALACFLSALILLGFFLSAEPNGQPFLPLRVGFRHGAYLMARLLAPMELLLFVIAIVMVARGTGYKASR